MKFCNPLQFYWIFYCLFFFIVYFIKNRNEKFYHYYTNLYQRNYVISQRYKMIKTNRIAINLVFIAILHLVLHKMQRNKLKCFFFELMIEVIMK